MEIFAPFFIIGIVFGLIGICIVLTILWEMIADGFRFAWRLCPPGCWKGRSLAEGVGQPWLKPQLLVALPLFPPYTILAVFFLAVELVRAAFAVLADVVEIVLDLLGLLGTTLGLLVGDSEAGTRAEHFLHELGGDTQRGVGNLLRPVGMLLALAGLPGAMGHIARAWRRLAPSEDVHSMTPYLQIQDSPEQPLVVLEAPWQGRYVVEEQLAGAGSSAELFVVRRLHDGRPTGERLLLKSFDLTRGAWLENLVRESEGMRLAKGVGLVVDYMYGEDYFYYVTPYYEGRTLGEEIDLLFHDLKPEAKLSEPELRRALRWVRETAADVQRFHRAGLIHKDIKPDNVIVTREGCRLIDLGLVTQLQSALTLTTHGTEYYRDPELVRLAVEGKRVNEVDARRFDIYALGALLYLACQGTFPGTGAFSTYRRPTPRALATIANRAMSDFDKRYRDVDALLDDLDTLLAAQALERVKPTELPSLRDERPRGVITQLFGSS